MKSPYATVVLSKTEFKLLEQVFEEAIDYWGVTDANGVRESKTNQKRIADARALLRKIDKSGPVIRDPNPNRPEEL